ncbi:glycosyltransferase family 2 protein [Haematomicrobium sanguinis]|uniref:glycosyltransferase family 2 protein n=1 Tax=Haematomicrobium sanguinis TaxID=479106 RepID=UPI00094973A5|nr:glycosyltransferase family 2 protein [Haematomicrobium sanguinis]
MSIDIMMPFYGDVAYAKRAVDSVLAQTSSDFHLTILDDAYPDPAARELFSRIASQNESVTYHRHAENVGILANFQQALDHAQRDWIVIMGGDDVMKPNYVEKVLELAAGTEASIIQPGVEVIDSEGNLAAPLGDRIKARLRTQALKSSGTSVLSGENLATSLMSGNWLYFPSLAWRRTAMQGHRFREGFEIVQDLALTMDVVLGGGSLQVGNDVVFQYRRHGESVSSVQAADLRRYAEESNYFRTMATTFAERGWKRAARAARLHWTSRVALLSKLPAMVKSRNWQKIPRLVRIALW